MKSLTVGVWTLVVVMLALLLQTIPPIYDVVWASYYESVETPEPEPVADEDESEPIPIPVRLVGSDATLTVRPEDTFRGLPVEIQGVSNCTMDATFVGLSQMPCIGVIIGE
jgi:hypothetical protein